MGHKAWAPEGAKDEVKRPRNPDGPVATGRKDPSIYKQEIFLDVQTLIGKNDWEKYNHADGHPNIFTIQYLWNSFHIDNFKVASRSLAEV